MRRRRNAARRCPPPGGAWCGPAPRDGRKPRAAHLRSHGSRQPGQRRNHPPGHTRRRLRLSPPTRVRPRSGSRQGHGQQDPSPSNHRKPRVGPTASGQPRQAVVHTPGSRVPVHRSAPSPSPYLKSHSGCAEVGAPCEGSAAGQRILNGDTDLAVAATDECLARAGKGQDDRTILAGDLRPKVPWIS